MMILSSFQPPTIFLLQLSRSAGRSVIKKSRGNEFIRGLELEARGSVGEALPKKNIQKRPSAAAYLLLMCLKKYFTYNYVSLSL